MVSINSVTMNAVRIDHVARVVGYFTALVKNRTISMSIGTFLSIAMSKGRGSRRTWKGATAGYTGSTL